MKRWTIEDLEKTTDLEFAACILNERRASLNPYTPLARKLENAENRIRRMDELKKAIGKVSPETLYGKDYQMIVKELFGNMPMDCKDWERDRQVLDACFAYLAEALPKSNLLPVLRKNIGLTEQEICKYQMGWLLED